MTVRRRWLTLLALAMMIVPLGVVSSASASEAPLASRPGLLSYWAFLEGPATAHRFANADSRAVARFAARTYEGSNELTTILRDVENAKGERWYEVRLAARPNDRTGWLPAHALGEIHSTRKHLIIDRTRFTATLVEHGRVVFRASVGVGATSWPTPAGSFYVRSRLSNSSGSYGPLAFGTSATSSLTEWPGGGYVGLHGTDQPGLLPGRVSHGCVRFANRDILRLGRLLGVGTPLTII